MRAFYHTFIGLRRQRVFSLKFFQCEFELGSWEKKKGKKKELKMWIEKRKIG
jgi:hypothetical protein